MLESLDASVSKFNQSTFKKFIWNILRKKVSFSQRIKVFKSPNAELNYNFFSLSDVIKMLKVFAGGSCNVLQLLSLNSACSVLTTKLSEVQHQILNL